MQKGQYNKSKNEIVGKKSKNQHENNFGKILSVNQIKFDETAGKSFPRRTRAAQQQKGIYLFI